MSLHLAVLGLLLVLALPAYALVRRARKGSSVDWATIRTGVVVQWVLAIALVGLVAATHDDPLGAFGGPGGDLLMDAMVAFILVGIFGIGTVLGARIYTGGVPDDDLTRTLASLTVGRKLLVALSAGVVMELLLRGYLLTQLRALGVGTAVAGVAAIVLGVLANAAHRRPARLVLIIPLEAAFVLAFVLTGNVAACILAHTTYSALVLLTAET